MLVWGGPSNAKPNRAPLARLQVKRAMVFQQDLSTPRRDELHAFDAPANFGSLCPIVYKKSRVLTSAPVFDHLECRALGQCDRATPHIYKLFYGAVPPTAAMSGGWMPCLKNENENDQFMRHAVQPRLVLVAEALGALRQLTMRNTDRGATKAAVQRLADHTAAVVVALKGHPNRVRTIGAWEDIVHARGLQRPEPLGEASAPLLYRLPLALLHKVGESLKTLELLYETAGEVLCAFKKIEKLTARLLWEVDEDNIGGEMDAARTLLDDIEGTVEFVTSLMPLDFVACDAKFGRKCLGRRRRPVSEVDSEIRSRESESGMDLFAWGSTL